LEPNTVFAARPPEGLPDHDAAWDIQDACQARIADAGFAQYEVSAYARPGRECAHNLNYWRFGDYLGIGAGAHGKLSLPAGTADAPARDASGTILRRWKHKHPAAWMAHAGGDGAVGGDEPIGADRRPFDFMLNALRLVEGFALDLFEARTGLPREAIGAELATAVERGWLEVTDGRVVPTELGRRFTNDVVGLFLGD
jgi:oxygen-independent coproporphyrinogen-3 oxidase